MGAGFQKKPRKEGWINVDYNPASKPDVLLDATKPLPFKSGSVEYIQANQFIEHFGDELYFILQEWHRVCRNAATIHIEVPNAKDHPEYALRDPDHKRFFVPDSFRYFNCDDELWQDFGRFYGIPKLRLKNLELANDKHDITVEFEVVN